MKELEWYIPVVGTDLETLVVHVKDQVLTLLDEGRSSEEGRKEGRKGSVEVMEWVKDG